jgi:hypothetical protein
MHTKQNGSRKKISIVSYLLKKAQKRPYKTHKEKIPSKKFNIFEIFTVISLDFSSLLAL